MWGSVLGLTRDAPGHSAWKKPSPEKFLPWESPEHFCDESGPVKGKSVSQIFWPQVEMSAQGTLESLQQVIRLTHL